MDSKLCALCGGLLIKGRLLSSNNDPCFIDFYPAYKEVGILKVDAFYCQECGHVDLFIDKEKYKKRVAGKEDGLE